MPLDDLARLKAANAAFRAASAAFEIADQAAEGASTAVTECEAAIRAGRDQATSAAGLAEKKSRAARLELEAAAALHAVEAAQADARQVHRLVCDCIGDQGICVLLSGATGAKPIQPARRPPSHATGRGPNLDQAALDIIGAADALHRAPSLGPVAVAKANQALHAAAIRAMSRGRNQRARFVKTLALIAADFAIELPPESRDRILSRLTLTFTAEYADLAGVAAGILLVDPTAGQRAATGQQPVTAPTETRPESGPRTPSTDDRAAHVPDGAAHDRPR